MATRLTRVSAIAERPAQRSVSVEMLSYCCTNNANRSPVSLRSTFSNCHVLFRLLTRRTKLITQDSRMRPCTHVVYTHQSSEKRQNTLHAVLLRNMHAWKTSITCLLEPAAVEQTAAGGTWQADKTTTCCVFTPEWWHDVGRIGFLNYYYYYRNGMVTGQFHSTQHWTPSKDRT